MCCALNDLIRARDLQVLVSFYYSFSLILPNIKSIKRIGPHNYEIVYIIIGSLFSKSYAKYESGKGTKLILQSKNKHILNILHNYFLRKGYCTKTKPKISYETHTRESSVRETNTSESSVRMFSSYKVYKFNTFSFRSFN
jgi:hypothetical protein